MKRIVLAAAALLIASCSTAPYPPPAPDPPPAPYPPPPGAPYRPVPDDCRITASRDWAAWINAMPGPGARPTLVVSGKVVTPTGGYRVALDPDLRVAESYPVQLFVTLRVTPPSGPATQALVTHEVRWEWPVDQPVGSVTVQCGEKTLARISPVQTAY